MTPVSGDARSDLAAAAEAARPRPKTGVRAILASLHSSPETAQQVRIETQALPPALVQHDGQWEVVALLTEGQAGSGIVRPPWGATRWAWPSGTFVGIDRWAEVPDGVVGWTGDWPAPASSAYDAVLDAIDRAGPEPTATAAANVHAVLREALPPPAIAYYRGIDSAPASDPGTPGEQAPLTSDTVSKWARKTARTTASYGLDPLTAQLERYRVERARGSFRACVVGEFNRGKSTLVNALLGRALLPTGPVPVTRSIVVVRAGEEESVDIAWPDGRTERRPLGEHAFEGLTLDHDPSALSVGEGEQGAEEPRVTLNLNDGWLRTHDLEVIDTPGTNEGRVDRVLQVRRAVVLSDIVILTVSALSPLSLSERQLLHDEVLSRHVAHVVVVITMTDLLDPAERDEAVESLRARILGHAPHAMVLDGPDVGSALHAEIGTRAGSEWAADRNRRWALQVADVCDELAQVAREALHQRGLDAASRATAAKEAEGRLRRDATTWEQIRLDLDGRRLRLLESVVGVLNARTSELSEVLFHELARAPDPSAWWKRDLPFRLRKELQVVTSGLEGRVTKAVTDDVAWLEQRAAADLGARIRRTPPPVHVAPSEPVLDGEVEDLTRTRRLTRLAGPAGTLIALLMAQGAGAMMPLVWTTIAGAGGTFLGERRIVDLTDAQRDEVRRLLERAVTETFRSFELEADRTISGVYGQLRDGLQGDQRAWSEARAAALARERHAEGGPDWDALLAEANALASTIRTTLGERGGGT